MALISKEDLLTKFETGALLFQPEVKRIIKIQPEVDAVPVVRCKDCKWFDPSEPCGTIEPLVFKCRLYGTFHSPGFFCGSGERRKSEEDPSHPCADSVMMGD